MDKVPIIRVGALALLLVVVVWSRGGAQTISVPPGFEICEFADGLWSVRTLKVAENARVSGRPVYPVVGPEVSLFVSDDEGGRIYPIRWSGATP